MKKQQQYSTRIAAIVPLIIAAPLLAGNGTPPPAPAWSIAFEEHYLTNTVTDPNNGTVTVITHTVYDPSSTHYGYAWVFTKLTINPPAVVARYGIEQTLIWETADTIGGPMTVIWYTKAPNGSSEPDGVNHAPISTPGTSRKVGRWSSGPVQYGTSTETYTEVDTLDIQLVNPVPGVFDVFSFTASTVIGANVFCGSYSVGPGTPAAPARALYHVTPGKAGILTLNDPAISIVPVAE